MERKNIFELLNSQIDYDQEVYTINSLFSMKCYHDFGSGKFFEIVNKKFLDWKYRNNTLDYNDMLIRLEIDYLTYDTNRMECSQEDFLLFCEAHYNFVLVGINGKTPDSFLRVGRAIITNIKSALGKIGYSVFEYPNDLKAVVVVDNAKAMVAADKVDEANALRIVEYNNYLLKGNLEGKRDILKNLADLYEGLKSKLAANNLSQLSSDIGFLLNKLNIRHNNEKDKKSKQYLEKIAKEDLEKWYDKTYDLILTAVMDLERIEISKEINELKNAG